MTISSLGGIGGSFFTPIINQPEVAILGIGRAEKKQVFINKKKLNGFDSIEHLKNEIKKSIASSKGFITPDKLYEKIIPFIVNNDLYRDKNDKIVDVENILNTNFKYKNIIRNSKIIYGWIL